MITIRQFLLAGLLLTACNAVHASPAFEGYFRVNGKDTALAHLIVRAGKPFGGSPTTILVFTEKDASTDTDPAWHAPDGKWGTALVVTLSKRGDQYQVIGSEFADPGLKRTGASSLGLVDASEIVVASGTISGQLATTPDARLFGDAIDIQLRFSAPSP